MPMTVSDFQPGDGVVYRSHPHARGEDGTVVRTNDQYVFVLYRGDSQAKATSPGDLSLLRSPDQGGETR